MKSSIRKKLQGSRNSSGHSKPEKQTFGVQSRSFNMKGSFTTDFCDIWEQNPRNCEHLLYSTSSFPLLAAKHFCCSSSENEDCTVCGCTFLPLLPFFPYPLFPSSGYEILYLMNHFLPAAFAVIFFGTYSPPVTAAVLRRLETSS